MGRWHYTVFLIYCLVPFFPATGLTPLLSRLMEYFRNEEDEDVCENFEEEYDNELVMDGLANILFLSLDLMKSKTAGVSKRGWIEDIESMNEDALREVRIIPYT